MAAYFVYYSPCVLLFAPIKGSVQIGVKNPWGETSGWVRFPDIDSVATKLPYTKGAKWLPETFRKGSIDASVVNSLCRGIQNKKKLTDGCDTMRKKELFSLSFNTLYSFEVWGLLCLLIHKSIIWCFRGFEKIHIVYIKLKKNLQEIIFRYSFQLLFRY